MSGQSKFWFERQITTGLLGLGLAISYLIVVGLPFPNEDLFVAFCSGRDTVLGQLGKLNQWSYAIPAAVWVDQSWLAHLFFYLSYIKMGASGPILIKGLLVAGALVLVFERCRALNASRNAALFAISFGALALAPSANARAHLFGMLSLVVLAQLLTVPADRNRLGQVGSVAVILAWSNLHGSFMLGFFLIGLRALAELIATGRSWWERRQETDRERSGSIGSAEKSMSAYTAQQANGLLGWLIALAASAAIMAFCNPYGPENLLMPFRQFLGQERTIPWIDWLPLLSQRALIDLRALMVRSAAPVLAFIGLLSILLVAYVYLIGIRKTLQCLGEKVFTPSLAMELLLPLTMVLLMFRFGRMVVFAVPLLIPTMAVLITAVIEAVPDRLPSVRKYTSSRLGPQMAAILALLWVACLGFSFYRNVVVLLQEDNPRARLRPDAGTSSQLLSYNFVGQDVAEFMKHNRLNGRVFCSLSLSNYLLLKVPGIQVFMDLRAHSAYPAWVIETQLWLTRAGQRNIHQTIAILDEYRVEYVVLDTGDDECRDLLRELLTTRKWGCIYQERNSCIFVLARADSPAFTSLLDGPRWYNLWYETPDDRVIAEAMANVFGRGTLPRELRERLKSVGQRRPDPDTYALIATGTERPAPCLDQDLKEFFQSEYHRLAGENYFVPGGERGIVMGLAKVAEVLEADGCSCSKDRSCEFYATARKRILKVAEDLRQRYRPF